MTAAVMTDGYASKSFPDKALKGASLFWYLVAVAGQWAFVIYIASFYGTSTLQGNFEAWSRNKNLMAGYVAGDLAGNLFFAAHVLIAAYITAGGAFQLVPQMRSRAMSFHRWNGRLYILTAFLMALGGLWLVWVRGTYITLTGGLGISLLAVLIMIGATQTLRYAMAHRIDIHRRWALRTFILVNGVWFMRLGYMFWVLVNQGPVGMTDKMDGSFDIIWGFGSYLLPLGLLEAYLRIRDSAGSAAKLAMTGVLTVATLAMAIGIFGAFMFMWRPLI